jgi:hypothetical protein
MRLHITILLLISIYGNVSAQGTPAVRWEGGNDFAGGYFDVVYEPRFGLLYALPNLQNLGLDNSLPRHPIHFEDCRREIANTDNMIKAPHREVEQTQGRGTPLYKGKFVVGKLNEVEIDGLKDWRFPTLREMGRVTTAETIPSTHSPAPSFSATLWQRRFCYSVSRNSRGEHEYYTLPVVTYGFERSRWAGLGASQIAWDNPERRSTPSRTWLDHRVATEGVVILVRTPPPLLKTLLDGAQTDPVSTMQRVAQEMVESRMVAKRRVVPAPKLEQVKSLSPLTKDEFETSAAFEKRVSTAEEMLQRENAEISRRNARLMAEYDRELNLAEQQYESDSKWMKDPAYRLRTLREMQRSVVQGTLGKPYFRDVQYDADSQMMQGTVYSLRSPKFEQRFRISVPLNQAKAFKANLLDGKLIPVVHLDENLSIVSVEAVGNEKRAELDYKAALESKAIKPLEEFIGKYADSRFVKAARQEIGKLEQEQRAAEKRARDEAQLRQAALDRQRNAEAQAYAARKQVGEQVCRPASLAFGLVNVTVRAFVEQVERDKIRLRISSTEGQTLHLNGARLDQGTIIWDQFSEWKSCN